MYKTVTNGVKAKWAVEVKSAIAFYLRNGPEGMFYYRMVDTVLSRDKNWVRWKAEHCPSMERLPFSTEKWSQSLDGAKQLCANKKLRKVPMNALDVSFLDDPSVNGVEALKNPSRYQIPKVESFQMSILDDELEIDMAKDEDEKAQAINSKQSKTWRALRLASKDRLNLLDKVEGNAQDLKPLFEPKEENTQPEQQEQEEKSDETKAAELVEKPTIKFNALDGPSKEDVKSIMADQTMTDDPSTVATGNEESIADST
jgi:THO complex subunit 1